MEISIIIPAFNEEGNIELINREIKKVFSSIKIEYEIIFIDDGSKDNTWENIHKLSIIDKNIKGIKFSRNFGKESAIFAGLKFSRGKSCVVIDSDLQHPPETILEM